MELQGIQRTFAVYQGNSYLVVIPEDAKDPEFLDNKDVTEAVKFERAEGGKAFFYNHAMAAQASADVWQSHGDGDNLHIFGHVVRGSDGALVIQVTAVAAGLSDGAIIADRLKGIPTTDYARRLAVAAEVRNQAKSEGNRDYWLLAADALVSQIVSDAATRAQAEKDPQLLNQAISWSIDLIHDPGKAAQIASTPWFHLAGGDLAQRVAKRMRKLNYAMYNGQWLPKSEALTKDFEDRYAALSWRDAVGYYKLGRWAESHLEDLPLAREMSSRCFHAGFRADPHDNSIRRELGMKPVAGGTSANMDDNNAPYVDTASGMIAAGPPGWTRSDPIDGDVTWLDPGSDTAYISLRVLHGSEIDKDFTTLWSLETSALQARPGFNRLTDEDITLSQGKSRRIRFQYSEGRYVRQAERILIFNPNALGAVEVTASYTPSEAESTDQEVGRMLSHLVLPVSVPQTPGSSSPSSPGTGLTPLTGQTQITPAQQGQQTTTPRPVPPTPPGPTVLPGGGVVVPAPGSIDHPVVVPND